MKGKITRAAHGVCPSFQAGYVPRTPPPPAPGLGPGARSDMARVRYTLASPYRNLPTPCTASAGGNGIGERSAIRAITRQGRASRSISADGIVGVPAEDPDQWSHAVLGHTNSCHDPRLGPTTPLRVPPQRSKSVTTMGTEFATSIFPLAEPRGSASITTLTEFKKAMHARTRALEDVGIATLPRPRRGTRAMRGGDERARGSGIGSH